MILGGIIYVLIAAFTFLQSQFGTDEAAKWVEPKTLYWIKISLGTALACVTALKMYTSDTFSKWKDAKTNGKNGNGHAAPISTTEPQPKDKP